MAIFSPITVSTQVVDSLFAYGWQKATEQLGYMNTVAGSGGAGSTLKVTKPGAKAMPAVSLDDIDILDGRTYDKTYDAYLRDLNNRLRSTGDEWAAIIGRMLADVMPNSRYYPAFVAWLSNPGGPYLGNTGKDDHTQRLSDLGAQKAQFASVVFAPIGITAPPLSAKRQRERAAVEAKAHTATTLNEFSRVETALKARYLGDSVEAILSEWQRAIDAVRDYLMSKLRAQLGIYGADSPALTQAKLENLADNTAVRIAGQDITAYEADIDGASAGYEDVVRRADSENQRARDKHLLFVQEKSERIKSAAQQARAALNSNNITVGTGLSERRQIDMGG